MVFSLYLVMTYQEEGGAPVVDIVYEDFTPYSTNDCYSCKEEHPTAIFCNQDETVGYCCPGGDMASSMDECQGNPDVPRECSNEGPNDFYFAQCFYMNEDDICGNLADLSI